jgi:hypothetical protein
MPCLRALVAAAGPLALKQKEIMAIHWKFASM